MYHISCVYKYIYKLYIYIYLNTHSIYGNKKTPRPPFTSAPPRLSLEAAHIHRGRGKEQVHLNGDDKGDTMKGLSWDCNGI